MNFIPISISCTIYSIHRDKLATELICSQPTCMIDFTADAYQTQCENV